MLVLTRKAGQSIQIGDDITVQVLTSQNGQIRLGILAPKHIPIQRDNAKNKHPRVKAETPSSDA